MTRSLIFCLLFVATVTSGLRAQDDIRFGFQLSPTFGWMTTNDNLINSDGTNLGLKLGLITEFYFRENYSFTTGINFQLNSGGTLYYEDTFEEVNIWNDVEDVDRVNLAGETSFKYDLQFVEIPLGLTLRTREFGYLRYYVQPLITLGILTQSRGQVLGNSGLIDSEESFDIGSATNAFNFSWGLGGGVEYSLSENTALIAGLAFQSGVADVTKDKNATVTRAGEVDSRDDKSRGKLNSIVLRFGIMF